MKQEEFLEKFVQLYEEQNEEVKAITMETDFRNTGEWGSLFALSLIAMIDDNYGVTLSFDDTSKCNTISDLFEMVKSKKG